MSEFNAGWSFPSEWLTDDFHDEIGRRVIEAWLSDLGVSCDCDNGSEYQEIHGGYPDPTTLVACGRCVLVEVGGIRVRARKGYWDGGWGPAGIEGDIALPAVEVTDGQEEQE